MKQQSWLSVVFGFMLHAFCVPSPPWHFSDAEGI
jgi:hypothetical protein